MFDFNNIGVHFVRGQKERNTILNISLELDYWDIQRFVHFSKETKEEHVAAQNGGSENAYF